MEAPKNILSIPASGSYTAAVIFVHGLGQSNLTWKEAIQVAIAPQLPQVKWIFPQAPKRPVSLSQGQRRPSWFDIAHLPPEDDEFDEAAIGYSMKTIEDVVLSQVHEGIEPRRIVLVGFSQGAALCLMTSLTTLHELGGVVSLSGWIPPRVSEMLHGTPGFPILWCHGTADLEIPASYAHRAKKFLTRIAGFPDSRVQLQIYEGLNHTINNEELEDLSSWLRNVLA